MLRILSSVLLTPRTLVIDSTNFKRWSLDDYHYTDPTQYRMHSDAFHVIERLQLTDAGTICYKMTIDDSNRDSIEGYMLAKPA